MPSQFDDRERHLLESADQVLPALPVARRATEVLAAMLSGVAIPAAPPDAPPHYFIRSATFLLSVLALRTARACLLLVAAGYMPEAQGLKRRLSEIHARAQAVADDTTGQHARDWLDGNGPSTARRIVGKFGSATLWKVYSWSAHADAQGVHHWLTTDIGGGQQGVMVPPRHDDLSNALLTEVGTECRDLAAVMAVARTMNRATVQAELAQVESLDGDLLALIEQYYLPDAPGE